MTELSDEQVFGDAKDDWVRVAPSEMTDAEVFGEKDELGGVRVRDDWERVPNSERPAPDIGGSLPEAFVGQSDDDIPHAFLQRIHQGLSLQKVLDRAWAGMKEGFGNQPLGLSDEHVDELRDLGVFGDPLKNGGGPVRFLNEALMRPTSAALDAVFRGLNAGVRGGAGVFGGFVDKFGGAGDAAEREATNFGNYLMVELGFTHFSRPGAVGDQTIGGLPTPQDFSAAGRVLDSPHVEANLRRMWSEDGIHPAEAVHDAQTDAFLKHQITAKPTLPEKLPDEEAELMGVPASLSAAVNTEPPLVPLSEEPAVRGGRLAAMGREAADQLLGLGKNIQYMLDPMATGSREAMVVAKDAANSVNRIRWDRNRIDEDLVKRFSPEQLERMWTAADEESVSLQLKEPAHMREHQGLATLEPEERAAIDNLHGRAQRAWLHAVDAGLVEGEGLPAYTPRMVLNVAAAGEDLGPRALNELGRNVFTKTAQMRHRGNLTVEETEAAAKELVGKRMAERGASVEEINAALEKVQVARNIRSLPLATARLEEAAVWREMINKVQDIGKAAGEDTVAVGYKPDASWFTIAGNPAFTRWEPLLEKAADGKWAARLDANGEPIMVPKPIYMSNEFRGPMTAILDESAQSGKVVQAAQSGYGAYMALKGKAMTAILSSPLIHNQVVWGKVMEAAGGGELLGFRLYWKGNRIVTGATGRAQELIERGLNPMGGRGALQDISGIMEEPNMQPGRSLTSKVISFIPGIFDEGKEITVKRAIDKAGDFWHNTLLWDRVRDVQFGLADHLSDGLVAKGVDRLTADRVATHFSNIIVGSIPKEAMSNGARAIANTLLFSRSFTLGNLSTFKQAFRGLPEPILAQIERDVGAVDPKAADFATSLARRKAISTVVMSTGLFYIGNAMFQHAFNIMMRDATVDDELRGYARRFSDEMKAVKSDPWELRHLVAKLSPTADNEPGKEDRIYVGNEADGTGIYARLPFGKFGEELIGYPTKPMSMLRAKLAPMASSLLDILENDKGFGRKIYNERDTSIAGDINTGLSVAKHIVMKHLPEGQISAGLDLLRGEAGPTINTLRVVGPALGFTASGGAPGGPRRGEQLAAKMTLRRGSISPGQTSASRSGAGTRRAPGP